MSSDAPLFDLQRKHCIMENMVFHTKQEILLCFQFKNFFSIASKIFPAEAFADKYFAIFPFQTFLLWNTWMTPSASCLPKQFSQPQEHLQNICLEVKIDLAPKRQFQLYFFHFSLAQSHAQVGACARTGESACSTVRLLGLPGTSRLKGKISALQGEQNFRWMRN